MRGETLIFVCSYGCVVGPAGVCGQLSSFSLRNLFSVLTKSDALTDGPSFVIVSVDSISPMRQTGPINVKAS